MAAASLTPTASVAAAPIPIGDDIWSNGEARTDDSVEPFNSMDAVTLTPEIVVVPFRLADTRLLSPFPEPGSLFGGESFWFGDSDDDFGGFAINVTTTDSIGPGYVAAMPHDSDHVNTVDPISTVNYTTGLMSANLTIVGDQPQIAISNGVGITQVIVDLFGFFTGDSP